MDKIKLFFTQIYSYLKELDKRIIGGIFVGILIIVGIFFSFQYYGKLTGIPQVLGANFSLEYKKIPFEVPSIDISFSTNIDEKTLKKEDFSIYPEVKGKLVVKNKNTLSYVLEKKLEVGKVYSISLASSISSDFGTKLARDYSYEFEAIDGAKVTKVLPEKNLDNISSNLMVLFNIPIINLSSLESAEKICPLKISPEIKGKCKWTNTHILEFIPEKPWNGATEYVVEVNNNSNFIFPLKTNFKTSFKTTELSINPENIGDNPEDPTIFFSPKTGIKLVSNFPVSKEELASKVELIDQNNTKLNININPENTGSKISETVFFVNPVNSKFSYDASFKLNLKSGIKPKYGNIATQKDINFQTKSINFLTNSEVNQDIFSETGTLVNTKQFYEKIPNKDLFLTLYFQEEISNDISNFALKDESNRLIKLESSYIKKDELDKNGKKTGKIIDNKTQIKIKILENLDFSKKYFFVVGKNINPALTKDIVKEYNTAPKFVISDYKYLNNTESCIYTTNAFNYDNGDIYYSSEFKNISTTPSSTIKNLIKESTGYNYDEKNKIKCPDIGDKKGYLIGTRFNPFSTYNITFSKNLKDEFGNTPGSDIVVGNIKTGDISEKDKYLYSSLSKDVNIIPSNVPLIVNLQSINLTQANLEICEMNAGGYYDYLQKRYNENYSPACVNKYNITPTLKNNYWKLTNNRFDIETDLVGSKLASPFIFVRGSTGIIGTKDSEREFANMYVRSNISLTIEQSAARDLIFASSFDGKELPSNLKFEFFTYKNGKLEKLNLTPKFNSSKKAYELNKNIAYNFVMASNEKYFGVASIGDDLTSNYDFKYISGQDSSEKNYLYLYTERPIYKPGDTVYYKGLLRQFKYNGYTKSDIKDAKLRIIDEEGKQILEYNVKVDNNSNFNGSFVLPKDIKLGRFNFEFVDAKNINMSIYNDGHFFVEEYKKPTFKLNIDSIKTDAIIGDSVNLKVRPEYYFGGKMINTNYDFSVTSQNYFFNAKDYADYQFGSGYEYFDCVYWGYCNYSDNVVTTAQGKINEQGIGEQTYSHNQEKDSNGVNNGERIYNYSFTVYDPDTKKSVSKTISQVLHNTDTYVGLQVPYFNTLKNGIKVSGITLNFDAKPVSGKDVKIEITKREWKNIKKQGVDGVFYNDYSLSETKESETQIKSSSNGEFDKTIQTKSDGEYEIKATYTGTNGKSFSSSSIIYVSGDSYIEWNNGNNTVTDLTAEKSMLKVGEVGTFTLKSPVKSGKMFVTIEKDDGILDYFVRDISSYGEKIDVVVKDSYYPNFYVKVFVIGQEGNNPLPIYKRALSVAKVATDYKKLKISIRSDKQNYLPGEKVKLQVQVTDINGNPVSANGSLSIVDESLLALKGNPEKNPFAFFYDMKRYLGVETVLSLKNLIEKLEVKDLSNGEKGGAGEGAKGGLAKKKRGIFKDTAFWQADFSTDKNGIYNLTTDVLPDNLTTWVVEGVISSADNKIGVGKTTFTTNKTVMISENLPRFLTYGDKITLSPVVFNKTGKDSNFQISVGVEYGKNNLASKSVFIKKGEQVSVPVEFDIKDIATITGIKKASKINIKAVSDATKEMDEIEMNLPVNEQSTLEINSTVGSTKDNTATQNINLTGIKTYPGFLKINYSPTVFTSLLDSIDFLNNFPYGCAEQQTSAIMPNVYIKKLYDSAQVPFDLKTKMVDEWVDSYDGYTKTSLDQVFKNYLVNILKFQRLNYGFNYWSDSEVENSNFHLTSYILESVSEIRNLGFAIDPKPRDNAVSYLKNRFYLNKIEGCVMTKPDDCKYSTEDRMNAISAILTYNKNDYEAYKMWKLLDNKNPSLESQIANLKLISKLLNISSLSTEDKTSLQSIFEKTFNNILSENLVYNAKGAFLGKKDSRNRLENTAQFLEAMAGTKNKDTSVILDNMSRWIISEKQGNTFGSTYNNAQIIKSIANYLSKTGELKNIKLTAKLFLNSNVIDEKNIDSKNKFNINTKEIPFKDLSENNMFSLNKIGDGNIYYDMSLSYNLPAKDIKARDEGFYLDQKYFDYNEYKEIESLKNEEFAKYMSGSISYEQLKYPKEVVEYLKPIEKSQVGQLVMVYNKIITPEPRDKVAFEGYIPSGSELINPNLSTENPNVRFNNLFDREEFRDDRYFGYVATMDSGEYDAKYIIRITHKGLFNVKPSRISEFYNEEVFGRSGGRQFEVK